MADIAKTRAKEIIALHSEVEAGAMTMLEKAIRIGELLTEQKTSMKHGDWIPWIGENLPFGRSESANYMRIYNKQGELNVQPVAHLKEAIAFLSEPKTTPETFWCHHCDGRHLVGENPCHDAAMEDAGMLPDDELENDNEIIVEDEDDDGDETEEEDEEEIDEPEPVGGDVFKQIDVDVKELKAICRAVEDVRKRTTVLVKKKGLVTAWLSPKLNQYLQNFRAEIKKAIPHALCPACGGTQCRNCNQTGYVSKMFYAKLIKENEHE